MPTRRELAPGVVVVDDFLSDEECAELRAVAEAKGFEDAPITTARGFVMRKDIRNNDRAIVDDEDRAEMLWQRLRPFAFDVDGRHAIGVNERFRFYRYTAGQRFNWHYDGWYETPDGLRRSFVTFMVYLNDGCQGGETRIVVHGLSAAERLLDGVEEPIIDVVPRTGMALLFLHQLRHTGAEVTDGVKIVLRSDVMYEMTSR